MSHVHGRFEVVGWWGRWHRIIGKFREESRHFQTRSLFASGYSESSHFIPSSAVMDRDIIQRLAVPGVTLLICFLAYTSQWLFLYIEPGPLRKGDTYFFNLLVACLLICFYRTCFTDPGRIPQHWRQNLEDKQDGRDDPQVFQRQRWCRRCETFKPPRAHHCKTCKRSVLT